MAMDISLRKVSDTRTLSRFIQFPMKLYAENPHYVPPILQDEKVFWNEKLNPSLQSHYYTLILALRGEEIVGRIAVFCQKNEKNARFGWFDCVEDFEVAEKLIHYAIHYASRVGADSLEGALGFTNLDQAGFLTEGFHENATPIGIYNYPYYIDFLEKLGFEKEKQWVEYKIEVPHALPPKIEKFNILVQEKYQIQPVVFKSSKEIRKYTGEMFALLEETYKVLPTFTSLSSAQKRFYIDRYAKLLHPDYVSCITDAYGKLIAFAITMPAYGKALQKAKGKLFPFGWWYLLKAAQKNDTANFYLIGIAPQYQRKGITSIIFDDIFRKYRRLGIKHIETNPELSDNKSIQALWQAYSPVLHKRRTTFKYSLL